MGNQFIHKLAAVIAFLGLIFAPVLSFAESQSGDNNGNLAKRLVNDELVQLEDLGMENPGLLATNPFYFLKTFRRSALRTFYFNPVRKSELELDILNEKAAEIKFLKDISPDNSDALLAALNNYADTLNLLKANLKGVKDNSNADQLLSRLLDYYLKHSRLFDELKIKSETGAKEKLDSLENSFAGIVSESFSRLESSDKFRARFLKVLESQRGGVFKELRAAEILDGVEEKTAYNSGLKGILLGLKEDLLLKERVKISSKNLNPLR